MYSQHSQHSRQKSASRSQKKRKHPKNTVPKTKKRTRKPSSLAKKRRSKIKWGRIAVVLVAAIGIGYGLAWFVQYGIPQIWSRLKIDISQLTAKVTPLPYSQAAYTHLTNELAAYLRQQTGTYGISGIDLTTGATFGWNANLQFTAANTSVLPVVLTLYHELATKQIAPGKIVRYERQDTEAGTGFIGGMPYGTPFTVLQLVHASIAQNDIVARNMLIRTLGSKQINDFLSTIGVTQTFQPPYVTTPQDLSLEMNALYNMDNKYPQTMMPLVDILENNLGQGRLAKGFTSNVNIAELPANWPHEYHDTALVFAKPHPLAVSICSDGTNETTASAVEAQAARIINQFIATGHS